jgi:hypothetical protein
MHLCKLPDGSVRFSHIDPWELRTFRALPQLADFSTDARAEQRLLPTPAVDEDLSPDMAMDWVEFVVPELREAFARNLDTVMADLDRLTLEPHAPLAEDEEGEAEEFEDTDDEEDDDPEADEAEDLEEKDAPEDEDSEGLCEETENAAPASESHPGEGASPSEPDVFHQAPAEYYSVTVAPENVEPWFRALNQARLVLSCRFGIDSENLADLPKLLASGELEYWFQYELFTRLQGWFVEVVLDPD